MTPQLLALDWGTSSLRAFLMHGGEIVDSRQSGHGIQHLPAPGIAGYELAFAQIAGDWLGQWPKLPVVASGMVGSAQGWREAPYVRCPADIQTLASQGIEVDSGLGQRIRIAPGVVLDEPEQLPDVMRGEEIQIAGALHLHPQLAERACILLPGTHSKWATIERGRIERFTSYLTGELFAVLKQHSILGRLMPAAGEKATETDENAFTQGLHYAQSSRPGDFAHQIFGARTLGLTGRLPHASLADYLSGLLIGHELASGLAGMNTPTGAAQKMPLVLIGEPSLCQRYTQALQHFGVTATATLGNTAPVGLWHFAAAAGLLE